VRKNLPTTPGWEGAGTVVESGGGLLGWYLKGKRVACAEYYVTEAKNCIPLSEGIPMDQASTLIINPLTAVGMVEKALNEKHQAIIQTAACSQVGRMVQALAKIPVIHIVRSKEQAGELSGEKWVLNSTDDDFREKLRRYAKELNATIGFDAVGGELTGILFDAMPPKSKLIVYGALAGSACSGMSPFNLIFQEKVLEGFWLAQYLRDMGFVKTYRMTNLVQELLKSGKFQTKIHKHVGFEGWKQALETYESHMTAGKMILTPGDPF
jgi:NADPH:quinone reductase-like Zn-dependent oxidoreductase